MAHSIPNEVLTNGLSFREIASYLSMTRDLITSQTFQQHIYNYPYQISLATLNLH